MSSPRRAVLFTCGWMITAADEDAIRQVPADAWKPGTGQDGAIEEAKDVAEITRLMSREGNWPGGLRWIVRKVKPSRGRIIVKTCGSRSFRRLLPEPFARPLDEFAVDEGRSGADQGDEVGGVDGAPAVLR
jgi:hypothetical protein